METKPDQEQFLALIEQNQGIILKICNCYCQPKAEREDLAQEIIFQLWKSLSHSDFGYTPDFKFSTWMYRVALNVAISYYRSGKKHQHQVPLQDTHLEISESLTASAAERDRSEWLWYHIGKLKDLDKALMLLYLEDHPYREIAEILGISESNVSTRIGRLKDKLKKLINHI